MASRDSMNFSEFSDYFEALPTEERHAAAKVGCVSRVRHRETQRHRNSVGQRGKAQLFSRLHCIHMLVCMHLNKHVSASMHMYTHFGAHAWIIWTGMLVYMHTEVFAHWFNVRWTNTLIRNISTKQLTSFLEGCRSGQKSWALPRVYNRTSGHNVTISAIF